MVEAEDGVIARAKGRLGTVLRGKYRLDRLLGIGGMAAVYAATHLRNANRVAVKVLHVELTLDYGLRERFLREGYAANSVEHSGTIRILDDDTSEDGALFLVMELLDGETLEARWERKGRKLKVDEAVSLMHDLLKVLEAAHAKGVVHRDLKPENLFVTRDNRLKVLDFGVARLREGSPTQTRGGAIFGTPAFMPPEQALGRSREVDALSDLWAVGANAFSLLSGHYVHDGETAEEMLVNAATKPAPALRTVAPHVSEAIASVIDRALSFEKKNRWPNARAMNDALGSAWAAGDSAIVGANLAAAPQASPQPEQVAKESGDVAPTPAMTIPCGPPDVAPADTLVTLPLPVRSTVAGVSTSRGEPRSSLSKRRLIVAGAAATGLLIGILAAVTLHSGSTAPPAVTASPASQASDLSSPAANPPTSAEVVDKPAPSGAPTIPVLSAEDLPKASSGGIPARGWQAPASAGSPSVAPSAIVSPPKPATHWVPRPSPKRDPLAP